jgi:hypothetical protein
MPAGRFEVPSQATDDEGQAARASRILALALGIAVSLALGPAPARAATTCSYDSTSDVLSVAGDPDRGTRLEIGNSNQILVYHLNAGGINLVGCAGSPPTTTNTDTIEVTHTQPGDSDTISVAGPEEFAPGVTDEQFGIFDLADEIEITLDLGGGDDVLSLQPGGAAGDSQVVLGVEGVNWNAGDILDDIDIATDDFPAISSYDFFLGPGGNTFTAQGGAGTGAAITAPLDLTGGDSMGRDRLTGGEGPDAIDGLGRGDVLRGAGGNDDLTGDAGGDSLIGGAGHDRLFAKDGRRDRRIDCGLGAADGATRDGKDPQPVSC